MMIDIRGLSKADVLAGLYNGAKPQGRGLSQANLSHVMTSEEAAKILTKATDFEYLGGRVMKVDLSDDKFDSFLYDRDNGSGKAESIINAIRNKPAQRSTASKNNI